jgi:hypothetical protein
MIAGWIAVTMALAAQASGDCGLVLRIEPTRLVLRPGRNLEARITLTNNGDRSLSLVNPGDGSGLGRRTPFAKWLFYPPGHRLFAGGCGNISPLVPGEVFILKPGESRTFDTWPSPGAFLAGRYRVSVTYENVPDAPFVGSPLGRDDPAELERVRSSDKCSVTSNEARIEVKMK